MRIAVLSDIHANRQALEAVCRHLEGKRIDRCWFLGDAVGYGPDPVAALRFLRDSLHDMDWVLGNHDALLRAGPDGRARAGTHQAALQAIDLNRAQIAQDAVAEAYWRQAFAPEREQAQTQALAGRDHVLIHASQVAGIDRYIFPWSSDIYLEDELGGLAQAAASAGRPRLQWYGHTHVPALIHDRDRDGRGDLAFGSIKVLPGQEYPLDDRPTLLNPGSIGQPRDLDRRAAYAIFDSEANTVVFHRVAYEWRETAGELIDLGYPQPLMARLKEAPLPNTVPFEWRAHFLMARTISYER